MSWFFLYSEGIEQFIQTHFDVWVKKVGHDIITSVEVVDNRNPENGWTHILLQELNRCDSSSLTYLSARMKLALTGNVGISSGLVKAQ